MNTECYLPFQGHAKTVIIKRMWNPLEDITLVLSIRAIRVLNYKLYLTLVENKFQGHFNCKLMGPS